MGKQEGKWQNLIYSRKKKHIKKHLNRIHSRRYR